MIPVLQIRLMHIPFRGSDLSTLLPRLFNSAALPQTSSGADLQTDDVAVMRFV
jgi:hypothetical protein